MGSVLISVIVYLINCLVILLCFMIRLDKIKNGIVKSVKLLRLFVICWVIVMVVGVMFMFIIIVSSVVILMLIEIGIFKRRSIKKVMIKIILVSFIMLIFYCCFVKV